MTDEQTRSNRNPKNTNNSSKKKVVWWKRIVLTLVALFTVGLIAVTAVSAYYISQSPPITESDLVGTLTSTIYDKDGNVISRLGASERVMIEADTIPQTLEAAVLSSEDRRFYDHNGVDIIRIFGALFANISSGGISQGGSTITQQLIKLSVFSTSEEDQTIRRKIQEAWIAVQLEKDYSKQQILSFYMNKVYMSNGIYGFGSAAKYYYGKNASQLTIDQAALLAGMVQAPNAYNPYTYPENAKNRRDTVLYAMLDNNKITQEQYDAAVAVDITNGLVDHSNDKTSNELAIDSYVQVVLEEVKTRTTLDPYTSGMSIYTNLDSNAQNRLVDILDTNNYINWTNDELQAAVAVTDPNTGALVALAGGRNISVQLGLNRATSATRSSGSAAKPLVDYAPAIEYLKYSTGRTMIDSPVTYSDGTQLYNWDMNYFGTTTLRTALAASRNTPALRTLREVGLPNAYNFLTNFDIFVENGGVNALVESNAIGITVSPVQLSAAYAAFANGGTYHKPFTINRITTSDGETAVYTSESKKAMDSSTAYMITDVLKGVSPTYAQNAYVPGVPNAGKSGTTNYTQDQLETVTGGLSVPFAAPDAWYVGYTKNYSIASWVGYDTPYAEGHYLNQAESGFAQLIYRNLMTYLNSLNPATDWTMPNTVRRYGNELYVAGTQPEITTTTSNRTNRSSSTTVDEDSADDKDDESTTRSTESSRNNQSTSTTQSTSR